MSRNVTIIMYHYVRDPERSGFSRLKALREAEFFAQLAHLRGTCTFVTVDDIRDALADKTAQLPENAVLLTFDDGYKEHCKLVAPALAEHGIQGAFFVPAMPIREGKVLTINKIHMIQSACPDPEPVGHAIDAAVQARALGSPKDFRAKWMKPGRYDPAPVMYVKRMLQTGLPQPDRDEIADELFARFVSSDEAAIAAEFYASTEDWRAAMAAGMYVGPHGIDHTWMTDLDDAELAAEISGSLDFMRELGAPDRDWVACYPNGVHDEKVRLATARAGAAFGITTRMAVADLDADDPLQLPRRDTNDFPKVAERGQAGFARA